MSETNITDIIPISPHDTNPIREVNPSDPGTEEEPIYRTVTVRGIRCSGDAGNVKLLTSNGNVRTIAIAVGETRWIATSMIYNTDTTATQLEGLV